jgi:methylmalonyl-CoA/ethylmalonyl-CoA epimerase
VAFLDLQNSSRVELLEPTESASTVAKFIDKRGPGIHHICLRVKLIDEVLKNLKNAGIKLINETPVRGAHNCRVAFVHPSSTGGVLIELSEKTGGL